MQNSAQEAHTCPENRPVGLHRQVVGIDDRYSRRISTCQLDGAAAVRDALFGRCSAKNPSPSRIPGGARNGFTLMGRWSEPA